MLDELKKSMTAKSLLRFAGKDGFSFIKPDDLFDPLITLFPEPDLPSFEGNEDLAALKLAHLAVLGRKSFSIWIDLVYAFDLCQSPIERSFLAALICICVDQEIDVTIHGEWPQLGNLFNLCSLHLNVYPQKQISRYKVDFLLTLEAEIPKPPSLEREVSKPGTYIRRQSKLAVECDGHQFHEKSKKQVSRDKQRDRTLQHFGYNVFRFSGSDIYRDVFNCAHECLMLLATQVTEKDNESR